MTPIALLLALAGAAAPAPARTPDAPPAVRETVTVAAVGHIVMGTDYPAEKPALPPESGKGIFDATRPLLERADVAFGNLAAPLSARGTTRKKVDGVNVFAFRTPPHFAGLLVEAGFDVLQAANNHILDFGQDAYADTLEALEQRGLGRVGRKGELYVKDVRGIRVGVMGFTQPYTDTFASHHDVDEAARSVAEAAARVDVLVVGLHGGTEGKGSLHTPRAPEFLGSEPRGEVVRAARAMVEAGADLVVGFGPHLPRAIEFHQGKLIDYSLGNFLTYGPFNLRGASGLSLVLEATFDRQGNVVSAQVHPLVVVKPGIPQPDPEKAALAHLRQLSQEDFPESCPLIGEDGALARRP